MDIRVLVSADAPAFQHLRLEGLRDCPTAFASHYDEECDIESVAARLEPTTDRAIWGAFDHGSLVGIVGVQREDRRNLRHKALIWGMYVNPAFRRNGVGRELLKYALNCAARMPGLRQVKARPTDRSQQKSEETPMPIRAARLEDIPRIHALRLAVRENVLTRPELVTPEHYRRMLEQEGRGWVFEESGELYGFAIADNVRRNLWALFVHPAHEGRGIGLALHAAMMEWFFQVGSEPVWLETQAGTRAERFYKRAGWKVKGTNPRGELRFELSLATCEEDATEV